MTANKKPSRGAVAAPTTPLSPVSSSSSTSCGGSRIVPSCPARSHKKKARARSGIGDAVLVHSMRGSSVYRGVSRHRSSGKYEAHLWDKRVRDRRGRQVYLGSYHTEEAAARTYDLAALKYWGSHCGLLNFPVDTYKQECEKMQRMTREEYIASLRRVSSGFTRGVSKYRGVAKHHQNGRWEARIGYANGRKYLYLGTFGTQEEAARAYDLAAIQRRGLGAVTNFDARCYTDEHLQSQPRPCSCKAEPDPEPEPEPAAAARPCPAAPLPLLQLKIEPGLDDVEPAAPALRGDMEREDVDRAIAEVLRALCVDRADFEARYPPRRGGVIWTSAPDDVRDLPGHVGFEDDIEGVLFDDAANAAFSVSCAAATISSLASGRRRCVTDVHEHSRRLPCPAVSAQPCKYSELA
ncbi:AP2-like ethylene-responsive transcription factor At1g79700 [Brachypodium distachyon]|uniref:AP2-like ethylene-responsive transcription factor At1g79700 n=1 Tax=Brachypodium distachyon TaxID=15368 RepID=UPI00071D232C|nr:AP2-like ethylene-responsive transcription factor At1g79700 [Brachypodium distachyon]|eukprot:XP_014754135.1 AP2-like ethylene-responsive transcription factor At1g79700 [Brachypodium distachyon]